MINSEDTFSIRASVCVRYACAVCDVRVSRIKGPRVFIAFIHIIFPYGRYGMLGFSLSLYFPAPCCLPACLSFISYYLFIGLNFVLFCVSHSFVLVRSHIIYYIVYTNRIECEKREFHLTRVNGADAMATMAER